MKRSNHLSQLHLINQICNTFEDQLTRGLTPSIESALEMAEPAVHSELLIELIRLELFYQQNSGNEPAIDSYYQRFPNDHDSVLEAFDSTCREQQLVETSDDVPATPVVASALRKAGDKIGRFQIESVLGTGAFADVYLAFDPENQWLVAIKSMKHDADEAVDDKRRTLIAAAFREEADTLFKLKHPGVAQVHQLGEDENGMPYVVLEYIRGDSLQRLLAEKSLETDVVVKLIADIARTLSDVHRQDIFHRDLKPANILVGVDGHPRIVDFGLAVKESSQHAHKGEFAGSISYMSPEQVRGQAHRLDGRSDIWSLGIMLYEALTGRLPFQGNSRQQLADEILHRAPRPPRQINSQIPVELEQACLKSLEKDSRKRYSTAADFAVDISNCLGEFSERLAQVSVNRTSSIHGKAELRLATQSRIWNEKPETQRLPTLWQYIQIFLFTDSKSRTAGEFRMMQATLGFYAKRMLLSMFAIALIGLAIFCFTKSNSINWVNREQAAAEFVESVGNSETERDRALLAKHLPDDADTRILKELASSFENVSAINNRKIANFLKTLQSRQYFISLDRNVEVQDKSLEQILRDAMQSKSWLSGMRLMFDDVDEPTRETIEEYSGMLTKEWAFCANLPWTKFREIARTMAESGYRITQLRPFESDGTTQVAVIWNRYAKSTPFSATMTLQQVKLANDKMEGGQFDIQNSYRPDFFSSESGVNGLTDFRIKYVPLSEAFADSNEPYQDQLRMADRSKDQQDSNIMFLRARALYHLDRLDESAEAFQKLARHDPDFSSRSFCIEVRAQLLAKLGNDSAAMRELKKFAATKLPTGVLNAKVLMYLGRKQESEPILKDLPPRKRARVYSALAGHAAFNGNHSDSKKFVTLAMKNLNESTPSASFDFVLVNFSDFDFLRKQQDLTPFTLNDSIVRYSGAWSELEDCETRFTDGSKHGKTPEKHLRKCQNFAANGFHPTKIRVATRAEGTVIASLWQRSKNKKSESGLWQSKQVAVDRNFETEQAALAAIGMLNEQFHAGQTNLQIYNLLKYSGDPTLRSELINTFSRLALDPKTTLLDRLVDFADSPDIQQAILMALCAYEPAVLKDISVSYLEPAIVELMKSNRDVGVHHVARLLLRRSGISVTDDLAPASDPVIEPENDWFTNVAGQTMNHIHKLWIASTETTNSLLDEFTGGSGDPKDSAAATRINFYRVAEFCNALSAKAGLPEDQWCYLPNEENQYAAGMKLKKNFQFLSGYRILTSQEWAKACQSGSKSPWFCGNDRSHLEKYMNITSSEKDSVVTGQLLPNRWGLFDMSGNALEWSMHITEDLKNDLTIDKNTPFRLVGGSHRLNSENAMSINTLDTNPIPSKGLLLDCGFRVVRKFPDNE